MAGERPFTDYLAVNDATGNDNHLRRIAYINAACDLIVADLQKVKDAWTAGTSSYRNALLSTDANGTNNIAADDAIKQILAGIGVFIKSELANGRIAVAVQTPSEEDEHSCFSDNTHRDIVSNFQGFKNILKGEYLGVSKGTSFYSLASAAHKTEMDAFLTSLDTKIADINTAATTGNTHFDTQIKADNTNRQNIIDTYRDMRDTGDAIIKIASDFGITLTTGDVTDPAESSQGQN